MTDPATDRPPQDLDAIQTGQRWPSADDLRPHIGKWVATRAGHVILSADSAQEIVATLRSRDENADSMFRVPVDPTRDVIELDAARAQLGPVDVIANPAARSEQTEPVYEMSIGAFIESVTPATGEDDYAAVRKAVKFWDKNNCDEITEAVLAALDLPGRERALREEIERLRAEYKDLAAFAETAHGDEAWTDLMGRYTAARKERDDLKRRIAEGEVRLEGVIDRLTAERDAANTALAKERAEHERALYDAHERGWNERAALDRSTK